MCDSADDKYQEGKLNYKEGRLKAAITAFQEARHFYKEAKLLGKELAILQEISPWYKEAHDSPESTEHEFVKTLTQTVDARLTSIKPQNNGEANTPTPLANVNEAPVLAFQNNQFNKELGVVSYNGQTIPTYFTDDQASTICGKMADSYARNVATRYRALSKTFQGSVYRYQLHYLANKALRLYGGHVLTFLSILRPLKFNNHTAYSARLLSPSKTSRQLV